MSVPTAHAMEATARITTDSSARAMTMAANALGHFRLVRPE